jgi:hypothetical protein
LFKLLESNDYPYEKRFGDCHNKLRLLLDCLSIAYKLSFVFVSDGSLQERLRESVIAKHGERMSKQLCQEQGIILHTSETQSFTLKKSDEDPNSILSVIRLFTEKLISDERHFRKVWDAHVGGEDQGSMYHYSSSMAKIIEDDIKSKLEELDFDKDPHQIVGELIEALQKFDKVSNRATLNVIKPKLE